MLLLYKCVLYFTASDLKDEITTLKGFDVNINVNVLHFNQPQHSVHFISVHKQSNSLYNLLISKLMIFVADELSVRA